MNDKQPQRQYPIGTVDLGFMGSNVARNMADHGLSVAGYDAG